MGSRGEVPVVRLGAGNRTKNALRGLRCWYLPYIKSRVYSRRFRPLLSYLFTDWKCNVNCYYCYTWDNRVDGMTLDVAKKSIDWLETVGCRVVAIMGGEPLLRKDFIAEVIRYGAQKGFFMYLPTNGLLLDTETIEQVGEAGVAAINLAVDTVVESPGLPKSFKKIERQFQELVRLKEKYGYIVIFNINITSKNIEDVRKLTEIAHYHNIGTDYHINEAPVISQEHYKQGNRGYWITRDYYAQVDRLVDWLAERNLRGYPMVNSVDHLMAMKDFIRRKNKPWSCRAGHNSLVIKLDGSLAPCFELYSSKDDWGTIFNPRLDPERLEMQKKECNSSCLSTCNYQVSHYYDSYYRGLKWVLKHAHKHFFTKKQDGMVESDIPT